MITSDPAYYDTLTGLYSPPVLGIIAEQYFKLARRFEYSTVLIVLDIDNLKQINAQHGRAEGDWALKQVAETMQSHFRESDVMGRLEEDQFAFLAMGVRDNNADVLATRLNAGLAATAQAAGRTYSLSVSAGMAWNRFDEPASFAEVLTQARAGLAAQQERKRGA